MKATEFADKYLGQESPIRMSTDDSRYRYYQWLRSWFGMDKKEVTNKCPFYQFMFWGSLVVLVSLIPLAYFSLIDWVVLKPLSYVFPNYTKDAMKNIYKKINKNKLGFAWQTFIFSFVFLFLVAIIFDYNVLAWVGVGLFFVFAVPYTTLYLLWQGILWVTYNALVPFFTWLFMIIFMINWFKAFMLSVIIFGGLSVSVIMVFLLFKFSFWFFSSPLVKWAIKKSCEFRERRIEKLKQYYYEEDIREKYLKKEAKEAKKDERKEKWLKWLNAISNMFIGIYRILYIFPGFIFRWLWKVLSFIWDKVKGFFVVVWSLITETVSNHCPPIDFVYKYNDTGILKKFKNYRYNYYIDEFYGAIFINDDKTKSLLIKKDQLPKGFKNLTTAGKKVIISTTLRTKDELRNIFLEDKCSFTVSVYEINRIEYVKKTKKS